MSDADAYLSHIVSRIQSDVRFLVDRGRLAAHDADTFLARLPTGAVAASSMPQPPVSPAPAAYTPPSGPPTPAWTPPAGPPAVPPTARAVPPPPGPKPVRARALWGYNEQGTERADLSFSAGDIIEIVSENNADWWTGRRNGNQGIFPSNYVEKIQDSAPAMPAPGGGARRVPPLPQGPSGYAPPPPQHQGYAPTGYAPASYAPTSYAPPPQGPPQGYAPPMGYAPPPVNVVAAPPPQAAPEKKPSKFGGLGSTMATAAAGGVGFGAGAAVGGGIIDAIF